ncbi:phospho-sugar mutase [Peptoniphilus sp.]|jgi:phosphoglucomutase|uniref:phospho-sugar mutase n=1 Tax=Peptoniphilus sp. TaxID=1971214 RepID=UPI003D90AA3F
MYREIYDRWLSYPSLNDDLKKELELIKDSDDEIKDRFFKELEFGTAGLRGILGAGTNRMNYLTVAKTALSLAHAIKNRGEEACKRGVVIARDMRKFSYEFSIITAKILAENGIKVYLFTGIRPTPILAYSIRYLNTISGVMITASHNPKSYNGFKLYWENGSQILDDIASEIQEISSTIDILDYDFDSLKELGEYENIKFLSEKVITSYFRETLKHTLTDDIDKNIKIVYTPLSGCGNRYVRKILDLRGFKNVFVVEEQENPDGTFSNVKNPNPENIEAFDKAIALAKEKDADIIIATDPDSDRVAVLENGDEIFQITGNVMGFLLGDFLLERMSERNDNLKNSAIVKTIVTGDMIERISDKYNVAVFETLTGFKNICNMANIWDKSCEHEFIFGYEESIGYVFGDHVRDKDAIITTMVIAEMAGYLKKRGKTLKDFKEDIESKYGYFEEYLDSFYFEGIDGIEKMQNIMNSFRESESFYDLPEITSKIDYLHDENNPSNVLKFYFGEDTWFALRPSGTEPKIKIYAYSIGENKEKAVEMIEKIKKAAQEKIN